MSLPKGYWRRFVLVWGGIALAVGVVLAYGAWANSGDDTVDHGSDLEDLPHDVDCDDVDGPIVITGSDPNGLDRDGDGIGCEPYP